MKILVLTKRQYTQKDILDDRFGRLRELPLGLAKCGHNVLGVCLSYVKKKEGCVSDDDQKMEKQVIWHSFNAGPFKPYGFLAYAKKSLQLAREFKPDIVYACSDTIYSILGLWLSRKIGSLCVIDLYDNFESFGSARIPGMLFLFRRTIRNTDGLTVVSEPLAEKIKVDYKRTKPTLVLVNGISAKLFYPQNQGECRKQLGLPQDAQIIGTAGALFHSRGIDTIFDGFQKLSSQKSNIHLALAGPLDQYTSIPDHPRIHYLGVLPLNRIPLLINSLNVAVICNKDSSFGRYCFPQKAYEILACRTPLVAASVGSMKKLLTEHPECLFDPEDIDSFVRIVSGQLKNPTPLDLPISTWDEQTKKLESFLASIIS
ncbi:MAG: glycosyltransferase [Candidatus Omnitrophota bacterium]